MKNYTAASRILFCAAFLFVFGLTAQAQAPNGDVPPAYGVAQRLQAEAQAAALMNNDEIAHRRAYQAVREYQAVVSSRAYGHTEYAHQALWQQASLNEHYLQDKSAAIQSLQALHNTFPTDPNVAAEVKRVGTALDLFNKTITPRSTTLHIIRAGLYHVMDYLVSITGRQTYSYWIAIIMISVLVKLALTPVANKQYASMREMQKLQPYIKELQAKHKNDKEVLGKKTMELYKEHGVNPAAGCAPLLFQMPAWILLLQMISVYQYHFASGTFLWIGSSLSHQFPNILGINLGQPDWPLLILYAGSMYVTQRMTITPAMDPQQAETQKMMTIMTPFMTTYFFMQYHYPSAFVLYYLTFNILSTAQQKYYMRGMPALSGGTGTGPAILLDGSRNGNGAKNGSNGNGSYTNGAMPRLEAEAKPGGNMRPSNGTAPAAKGVIAPKKVHPKKKRR